MAYRWIARRYRKSLQWLQELGMRIRGRRMARRFELPKVDIHDLITLRNQTLTPIIDDIFLPPYRGTSIVDDLTPLLQIVSSMRPSLVVEFGTAYGNITANICRHVPDAEVYTVNALPEDTSGQITTVFLDEEEIGRVYRKHGYENRVHQIYSNTLEVDLSTALQPESVDLAIIDACHDPEYIVNDFHKVRPYLRVGGIALFHDTHPSMKEHLLGSYLGCMMLRKEGWDIRHLDETWWGVWVKRDG